MALRPTPAWRIEVALDAELWSTHDEIDLSPHGVQTAAAPIGYVSVLTVDSGKHLLGLGGGREAGGWQIGASLGIAILSDVQVSLAEARCRS